jgi:formate hydrogenlyase subunit 3/multisubunit Na+/H+ antiporter MnhD subunit
MGLNAVFLGHDLFNLYVALEVIAFAGVPLVCLKGTAETYRAALRYLIFALIGSAFYLLGAVLLYGAYGTLDLTLLSERVHPQPALWLALALMTAGLAAKTALFPLHLWLPPAHAGAPPAASALLSALVVKGSFFLAVRLWFDLAPDLIPAAAWQIPGVMGAGAILVGGVMALRQERLKLLIAYSTVAQIGYLFLIFPLAAGPTALAGGMLQAVSHAFAKAAMFLAAGLLAEAAGSDRLVDLRGTGRALPVTVLALGLAAVSLLGVPPTGGFLAKWLLLGAAVSTEQWGWAVVLFAGGLLAGGYLYRAVLPATREGTPPSGPLPSLARQFVVLALALGALGVGMFPAKPLELLQIGRPVAKEVR